jgi:hypothetical protein
MSSNSLLHYVLPIASAPDFRDVYDCTIPSYGKNPLVNLRKYKMYNMLKAQIWLHNEIDSFGPGALIDEFVLTLMYHPRFPDTFFNFIANSVDGLPILLTEEVEPFLERNYNDNIEQPDCEYLLLILTLWSKQYTVLRASNLNRALAWIEDKRAQLPIWSANSTDSLDNMVAASNPDTRQSKDEIAIGLLPNEIKLLKEVLTGVDLLNDDGSFRITVQPGQVAGVIRYLIKHRNFTDECSLIFNALKSNFGSKISLSTIQHYMNLTQRNINFYNKTRQYFEEVNYGR